MNSLYLDLLFKFRFLVLFSLCKKFELCDFNTDNITD